MPSNDPDALTAAMAKLKKAHLKGKDVVLTVQEARALLTGVKKR